MHALAMVQHCEYHQREIENVLLCSRCGGYSTYEYCKYQCPTCGPGVPAKYGHKDAPCPFPELHRA